MDTSYDLHKDQCKETQESEIDTGYNDWLIEKEEFELYIGDIIKDVLKYKY